MPIDKLRKKPFLFWVRRNFTTGLLVFIPTILTVYLLWVIFIRLDGIISNLVRRIILQNYGKPVIELWHIPHVGIIKFPPPGFGLAILILVIFIIGILARNIIGSRFIRTVERRIRKIPLISLIYFATKQISYVFIKEKGAIFQRAVLLEYPRKGIYSIGFTTTGPTDDLSKVLEITGDVPLPHSESPKEEAHSQAGKKNKVDQKIYSVFIPTTPNPTSGFLLYIPANELIFLDINIEDAMKLIISGGTVLPGESMVAEFAEDL